MGKYYLPTTSYMKIIQSWSEKILSDICRAVQQMAVCEGNSDDSLVDMVRSKGGVIMNGEVVTASLDENTIRHAHCHLCMKRMLSVSHVCIIDPHCGQ